MELTTEDMEEELIRFAYEKRDKTYDIALTEEEKNQRFKKLYKEREYIESVLDSDIEDIRESFKWRKIQAEIYGLKMGCMDPDLCKKVLEYKISSSEEIVFEYAQVMADGQVEFDAEVLRYFLKYFINDDFIIRDKNFLRRAIETTGESLLLATLTHEDTIKDILLDIDFMKKILGKKNESSSNFLSGKAELEVIVEQLRRCQNLSNDDLVKIIDNTLKINENYICYCVADSLLDYDWNDEEGVLLNKVFDLLEICSPYDLDADRDYFKNIDFINDEELAYRYCKIFSITDCVDDELLKNRDFLLRILDNGMYKVDLPKEFYSDNEILEKYFSNVETASIPEELSSNVEIVEKYLSSAKEPSIDSISIEVLNNERIAKIIEKRYGVTPNTLFLNNIAEKIAESGTIVTHYGDDLDNKATIEALQRWAEDNDYIKIGNPLNVVRVPAGTIKQESLNIDTGGHNGSFIKTGSFSFIKNTDTIIIDGDTEHGVKSACEALSRLGIYVPEQIVELADTKSNKVSNLDSRSGLALVRYLDGEQIFKLAEEGLLDKSLTDEQLEEYGLTEGHKKQQEIIDNAVAKIEEYTEELPNGEKIVLAPVQILAGSSIAYDMGINYYVSASKHFDGQGIPDGVTFAITSKPGIQLPEKVLEYGRKLSETYATGPNTSDVFVNPNNQMIVAGGFKNPEFKIAGESTYQILNKIFEIFKENEKNIEEQKS